MALCPRCKQGSLQIDHTLELGPDGDSDEYTFKLFSCPKCPLVGAGYYEESRRGSSDSWHHRGYEIPRSDYDRVSADLAACPDPTNHMCRCAAHVRYRVINKRGSTDPLSLVTVMGDLISLN